MISNIKEKNPNLNIKEVSQVEFTKFGKVLDFSKFLDAKTYLDVHTEIPLKDNVYVAHDEEFQKSLKSLQIYKDVLGKDSLEFGYVNGQNTKMNSLEYHNSSEINIAITPLVLLLGSVHDIQNKQFNSSNLTAFYVPENTVIEIFPTTLHFSPCKVLESGFKCGVILPYGTNMNFEKAEFFSKDEDYFLFKTNKWLLAHPDHQKMIQFGAFIGITGNNIEINY